MEEKADKINPPHYRTYPIEVIDMMVKIFGGEDVATYCLINAMKYRFRVGHKIGENDSVHTDLEKEAWYLNKYRELSAPTE